MQEAACLGRGGGRGRGGSRGGCGGGRGSGQGGGRRGRGEGAGDGGGVGSQDFRVQVHFFCRTDAPSWICVCSGTWDLPPGAEEAPQLQHAKFTAGSVLDFTAPPRGTGPGTRARALGPVTLNPKP